jgi:hypothetical protein
MNALLILTLLTLIRIVLPVVIVLSIGEYAQKQSRSMRYGW